MIEEKNRKASAVGTLCYNIIRIDDSVIEWLDAKEFSLVSLAKLIGVDADQKVKAKITIEIVQEPCEICGKLTTGDKLCSVCGKVVCDDCAKIDATGRYCPTCYDLKKHPVISH